MSACSCIWLGSAVEAAPTWPHHSPTQLKAGLKTTPCALLSCPAYREGQFGMFDSVFFEVKTQVSSVAQT